jgi:hypothetical protein
MAHNVDWLRQTDGVALPQIGDPEVKIVHSRILSVIGTFRQLRLSGVFCGNHQKLFRIHVLGIGIGGLLIELFKTQVWDVCYVQVAISLTFIVVGILIP